MDLWIKRASALPTELCSAWLGLPILWCQSEAIQPLQGSHPCLLAGTPVYNMKLWQQTNNTRHLWNEKNSVGTIRRSSLFHCWAAWNYRNITYPISIELLIYYIWRVVLLFLVCLAGCWYVKTTNRLIKLLFMSSVNWACSFNRVHFPMDLTMDKRPPLKSMLQKHFTEASWSKGKIQLCF